MSRMTDGDRCCFTLAGILCAVLIYAYPLTLPTPLLDPDEGLHASISQEMLERGEWVTPTLHGQPFLDKPIVYFWTQMISMKIFGMNEFAVRLPGSIFGLLGSITTGLLSWRLFGSRIAVVATLTSLTMFLPLAMAQAATHDVALVPWTNLALLCLWNMEKSTEFHRQTLWMTGAASMVGLAILTKALLGIAIVAIACGLFLLISRRISIFRIGRLAIVLMLGLVMASPWYIAMEFRSSGYLYYYFIERHILGFATTSQRHGNEPWYFYAPYMILGSIPWLWFTVPLLRDEWQNRQTQKKTSHEILFLVCWLAGGLLFLSVAKSKLATYALPLFPAISILTAVSWQRFVANEYSTPSRNWLITMNRIVGVTGAIAPFAVLLICQSIFGASWPIPCWLAAAFVSAVSIISVLAFERQRYEQALALCCAWVAFFVATLMTWPLQTFAEDFSERSLAEWINREKTLPQHLILVGKRPASVIFYLKPALRRELQPGQFIKKSLEDVTDEPLRHGDVLAVSKNALKHAELEQRSIPLSFKESAGQFLIAR